jgi:hypothetical protein
MKFPPLAVERHVGICSIRSRISIHVTKIEDAPSYKEKVGLDGAGVIHIPKTAYSSCFKQNPRQITRQLFKQISETKKWQLSA